MTNENTKSFITLVLTALGYIYYVFPTMHESFNPITFWQKLTMFFTMDILSLVGTLIVAAGTIEVLNKIYEKLTKKV
jgi:hypothetical protein